jgi:hypothetical protein
MVNSPAQLAILLFAISIVASLPGDWTECSKSTPLIRFNDLSISPYPFIVGKNSVVCKLLLLLILKLTTFQSTL